jgi:hypothetical protein
VIDKTFTVDWGECKKSASSNGWTIIQWERKTKQKFSKIQELGVGIEDMYLIAWIALRDAEITVTDFERFCKTVTDFQVDGDDANPTHAAAGEGE